MADKIEYDVKINGKEAKATLDDIKKSQENLEQTVTKTNNNIKTSWVSVGGAIGAGLAIFDIAINAVGSYKDAIIEYEKSTFNLTESTKKYIEVMSEQLGVSQELIGKFVQTGKAAGLTGEEIDKITQMAIALGRAFPNESAESFIDNLTMLNKTGEAQGYIVDILEQKYGAVDLKTISLADKMAALEEVTKGVNEEFANSNVGKYEKSVVELENVFIDLGTSILGLLEESGAFTLLNKGVLLLSTSVKGLGLLATGAKLGIQDLFGEDTTQGVIEWKESIKDANEDFEKLIGKVNEAKNNQTAKVLPDIVGTEKPVEQSVIENKIIQDKKILELEREKEKKIREEKQASLEIQRNMQDAHIKAYEEHIKKEYFAAVETNNKIEKDYEELGLNKFDLQRLQLARQYEEEAKYAQDINKLNEIYAEKGLKILEEEKKETETISKEMGESFSSAFGDVFAKTLTSGKLSFRDFTNSIISDIARITMRQTISKPIGDAFSGVISSMVGAFNGSKDGGLLVNKYATGGILTGGSGVKDDLYLGQVNGVHQLAMGGEFITKKSSVNSDTLGLLQYINDNGKLPTTANYSEGGMMGTSSITSSMGSSNKADVFITINAVDTQTGVQFLIANKSTIEGIISKSLGSNSTIRNTL